MRISDWSSDVCSSDLTALRARYQALAGDRRLVGLSWRSTNRRIGVDKSIPVHDLLSALRQPGIQWLSLQYGDCAEDLAALRGKSEERRVGKECVQTCNIWVGRLP